MHSSTRAIWPMGERGEVRSVVLKLTEAIKESLGSGLRCGKGYLAEALPFRSGVRPAVPGKDEPRGRLTSCVHGCAGAR